MPFCACENVMTDDDDDDDDGGGGGDDRPRS